MDVDKDALIEKMEYSRLHLNTALEMVAPEMEIYPSWKLKQLLDHITGWDELVASALRQHSMGEQPPLQLRDGINGFNNNSVTSRKELSLGESRQAYDESRVTVLQALRYMPEEKFNDEFQAPWGGTCTVTGVVEILISHELEHAKHIEEAIKKSVQPLR